MDCSLTPDIVFCGLSCSYGQYIGGYMCCSRVQGNRRAVDFAMKEGMYEVLRANDQLRREMAKGNVFKVSKLCS